MDVNTLVATLRGALDARNNLPFNAALIQCPALDPLLRIGFPDGTVPFGAAVVAPSADGKRATVNGTVSYGTAACVAALALTPDGDGIDLLLTLTPAAPWTLAQLYPNVLIPGYAGLRFTGGGIVLCSTPYRDAGQGIDLPPGMNMLAVLDIAAGYPALAALLGAPPRAVTGPVSDGQTPLMTLASTPASVALGPISLTDLALTYDFGNIAPAGQPVISVIEAGIRAQIAVGPSIKATAQASLPSNGSQVLFTAAFTGASLKDFADLAAYIGHVDPLSCLPDPVRQAVSKAASALQLTGLSFTMDTSSAQVLSAGLQITLDLGGFQPFSALPSISIDSLSFDWNIQPPTGAMEFGAVAHLQLTPTCPMLLGIQTQPGLNYVVELSQAPGATLSLSDLVHAFAPGLPFPELTVEDFVVTLQPDISFYELSATITGRWSVLQDLGIELASVSVDVQYNGALSPTLSGWVSGTLTFQIPPSALPALALADQDGPSPEPPAPEFDLVMRAERPAASDAWLLQGGLAEGQIVPLDALLAALAHKFNVSGAVPAALRGTTLSNLGLNLDTGTPQFHFGCQIGLQVGGSDVELMLAVDVAKEGTGYHINFGGALLVGGLEFDLIVDTRSDPQAPRTVLLAQYQAHDGAGEIDVKKLLASVVPDVAAGLPDGLVIDLADAMIAIVSENGQRKFLFAMDIALEFPLSSLPLIGKAVPQDAKAGLKNLKLIVSSAALSADDVTLINSLSPKPVLPEPAAQLKGDAVPKGFSMAAQIELGQFTMLLTSPPAPANTKGLARAHAPYASPAPSSVTWVNVQKSFGPVSIQKVGFAYDQGSLYVLSNLSLAAGGLEIDLIGIGMGSPIKQPRLGFTIEGLAISYQQGPVSIMGGMLGTLDPLDFTGALSVKVPQFSLAALAGYAQYQDHPSFFLYGVLNAPLGGPPAFFVNGVAAGVGFNRKLLVPDVSGVASFPLVQWAQGDGTPSMDPSKPIGDQVQAVLTMLSQSGVVAPSVGDYWLAAGLRFTSFELVDSFALLTVSVGADVEIDLLGLSTVTVPPQDPVPVAEVQIALEVSFSYARGLVAVAGQLTDNSYVLSRDCKLTGGFAFYVWFKGERAGEAVLSLGGYNPNFTVPKDYPVVPRLGLNWQVIPELSITGGLYFAVTPNVIMAGGKLSAVWDSGPIRAWFTYWADFLMTFKPFHYHVNGGIDLGASFTVDLWLFSISVTIHIGVELTLKGPPFSGQARVDLSIISFTISFGDAGQGDTKIPWSQFVQQLLPSNAPPAMARRTRRGRLEGAASAPRADDVQPAVVQINLTGGLVRRLPDTADGPCYLVSAETFQCSVLTTIPAKSVAFDTNPDHAGFANLGWAPDAQQPCDPSGKPIPVNNSFGVGPARIASGSFNPALTLSLESEEDSTLQAVRMLSNAPKALWEVKQLDANGVPQVDPGTALTDASFANALVGLTLSPCVAPPDTLCPVPLESLLYTLDDDIRPFAWSPGQPPAGDDFSGQTVAGTIASAPAARQRGLLLAALAPLGVNVDTQVNVARLANPATNDLESAPRLRLLGEQAAA